jgi:hypothetical protein
MKRLTVVIITLLISGILTAQERKVSFGFVLEPIIPTKLFRITTDESNVFDSLSGNNVLFTSSPRYGYAFGAILKFDFTQRLSAETGINYLVRHYSMTVQEGDERFSLKFMEDSYEIPLTLKYFIRLGDRLYLGNSAGASLMFIPGSIETKTSRGAEFDPDYALFRQQSLIRRTMVPAFKGGFGLNYRTESSGEFFFETHYRLFSVFYDTRLTYFNARTKTDLVNVRIKSIGDYFGFSIRYTFPSSTLIQRDKSKKKTDN